MISHNDIEKSYIDLYSNLRNYFWDYDFIQCLANLEDTVFYRFPDVSKLRRLANSLYADCSNVRIDDKDLDTAFKEFKNLIERNDVDYSYVIVNIKNN